MAQERKGITWLTHQYTNLWVEGLRLVLPEKNISIPSWIVGLLGWSDSSITDGKDLAYIIGHIIVYGHIPAILGGVAIAIKMFM